jgi:hypothetical protein
MANYVFAYSGGKGVSADETERNEQYAHQGRWLPAVRPPCGSVRPAGFEPATFRSGGERSIP